MNTFEQKLKIKLPDALAVNTEEFIRKSEVRFASIELYLKKRPRISTSHWGTKSIVLCTINGQIDFDDPIEFIQSQNGIFPNAEGLSIAAPLLKGNCNMNTAIYGFDEKQNLWEPAGGDEPLFVPFIAMKQNNFYFGLSSFGKNSYAGKTDNSYLVYLSD